MTIPAAAQIEPLTTPSLRVPLVDPETGSLTQNGWQTLQAVFGFVSGTNRIMPCNATGTNTITLTMATSSGPTPWPLVQGYRDFDTYRAVAANTTSGNVSALVVTPQGTLATLNVYKASGATRATTGDVVAGSLYDFIYVDSLNANAGGFVLK